MSLGHHDVEELLNKSIHDDGHGHHVSADAMPDHGLCAEKKKWTDSFSTNEPKLDCPKVSHDHIKKIVTKGPKKQHHSHKDLMALSTALNSPNKGTPREHQAGARIMAEYDRNTREGYGHGVFHI